MAFENRRTGGGSNRNTGPWIPCWELAPAENTVQSLNRKLEVTGVRIHFHSLTSNLKQINTLIFKWFIPVVCDYNIKYQNYIRWVRYTTRFSPFPHVLHIIEQHSIPTKQCIHLHSQQVFIYSVYFVFLHLFYIYIILYILFHVYLQPR